MNFTKDFEAILVDFFKKYDGKNLKTVPEIMKRFRQNKVDVMLHLCNKYNVDINTIDGVDMSGAPAPKPTPSSVEDVSSEHAATTDADAKTGGGETGAETDGGEADAAPEPKKKSKLPMIIGIVVVLCLGAGGFFMKDTIMGMFGGDNTEEIEAAAKAKEDSVKAATDAEAAAKAEEEAKAEAEAAAKAEAEALDSLSNDSTSVDSLQAEEGAEDDGGEE